MDTAAVWIDMRDIAARQSSHVSDGVSELIERRYMSFTNPEMLRRQNIGIRITPVNSHAAMLPDASEAGSQQGTLTGL